MARLMKIYTNEKFPLYSMNWTNNRVHGRSIIHENLDFIQVKSR